MGSTLQPAPGRLHAQLAGAGFTRTSLGAEFRCNGALLRVEGGWPTVRAAQRAAAADPLLGQLGQPGLWKCISNGAEALRVFDLPPLADGGDGEDGRVPLTACLEWAV